MLADGRKDSAIKTRIVIGMEGGVIHWIAADRNNVEVLINDFDVEGGDEERLCKLRSNQDYLEGIFSEDEDDTEEAYCFFVDVDIAKKFVDYRFKEVGRLPDAHS